MKFRDNRRREDPEIILTPMIDVVFLLLIFFMLSTTFSKLSEIEVDLPEAQAMKSESNAAINLIIDVQGRYFLEDKLLINRQTDTLRRALEERVQGRKDAVVLISADAKTPHQAVITAMDAARQAGIVHVSLATRDPAPAH
jgi:biopolymer transport protein ExbD